MNGIQNVDNGQLNVVINAINLSILFAKKPFEKIRKNTEFGVFGFSYEDTLTITIAIREGVNIAEELLKYIEVSGVGFLQDDLSKKQFICDIKR